MVDKIRLINRNNKRRSFLPFNVDDPDYIETWIISCRGEIWISGWKFVDGIYSHKWIRINLSCISTCYGRI